MFGKTDELSFYFSFLFLHLFLSISSLRTLSPPLGFFKRRVPLHTPASRAALANHQARRSGVGVWTSSRNLIVIIKYIKNYRKMKTIAG
jgi:hypothetical protein